MASSRKVALTSEVSGFHKVAALPLRLVVVCLGLGLMALLGVGAFSAVPTASVATSKVETVAGETHPSGAEAVRLEVAVASFLACGQGGTGCAVVRSTVPRVSYVSVVPFNKAVGEVGASRIG